MDSQVLSGILKEAMEERASGAQILVAQMNKNKKFQKEQLAKEGYTEFKMCIRDRQIYLARS